MSKLVIRKRVSLDFLGDGYKDAWLEFQSVPMGDFEEFAKSLETSSEDETKSINAILGALKKYYLNSAFPNDEGVLEPLDGAEELNGLDKPTLIRVFGDLTGQGIQEAIETQDDMKKRGLPKADIDDVEVTVPPKSEPLSKNGSTAA